jgi:hypothetical protein
MSTATIAYIIPNINNNLHTHDYALRLKTAKTRGVQIHFSTTIVENWLEHPLESQGWRIEVYHRVIKQCYGIERALSAEGSGAEEPLSLCPAGISAFGDAQVANGSLV